MSNQITRRQHQVPQFYLRLWADGSNKVRLYDLKNKTVKHTGTKKILFREFYYEEDPANPDNRIENGVSFSLTHSAMLSKIETECAPILKRLNKIIKNYPKYSQNSHLNKDLSSYLTIEHQKIIKMFLAFQYLRIPGAIDQKEYELQGSSLQQPEIDYGLNPGRFVENGFNYFNNQFMALKMIINYSFDSLFLTSDWPCFDMKDSDFSPLLGEELGRSSEVIACCTLNPRLRVILYPKHFPSDPRLHAGPDIIIKDTPDSQVKNHNTLIIQQCMRYVVSNTNENYILKVKRKRN